MRIEDTNGSALEWILANPNDELAPEEIARTFAESVIALSFIAADILDLLTESF